MSSPMLNQRPLFGNGHLVLIGAVFASLGCGTKPAPVDGGLPDVEYCGDDVCDMGETAANCPQDCTVCGNSICEVGETSACPKDCTAVLVMRNTSSYAVYHLYVYGCAAPSEGSDQLNATIVPSGSQYSLYNIPPGCYFFHATTLDGSGWRTPTGVTLRNAELYTWTLTN